MVVVDGSVVDDVLDEVVVEEVVAVVVSTSSRAPSWSWCSSMWWTLRSTCSTLSTSSMCSSSSPEPWSRSTSLTSSSPEPWSTCSTRSRCGARRGRGARRARRSRRRRARRRRRAPAAAAGDSHVGVADDVARQELTGQVCRIAERELAVEGEEVAGDVRVLGEVGREVVRADPVAAHVHRDRAIGPEGRAVVHGERLLDPKLHARGGRDLGVLADMQVAQRVDAGRQRRVRTVFQRHRAVGIRRQVRRDVLGDIRPGHRPQHENDGNGGGPAMTGVAKEFGPECLGHDVRARRRRVREHVPHRALIGDPHRVGDELTSGVHRHGAVGTDAEHGAAVARGSRRCRSRRRRRPRSCRP